MSDVSGIPYMGPMGQGNFFAPQFSYNPQINPTAGYAGPEAYAQNVTNNLYSSGGGFGTQTAYYAGLGASYGRQIAPSYENPYAGGGVPASLAYPGASLSGGYTTGAANMPSFDTGPNFGFTSGGAGAIDLSRMGNLFSGGLGGGGSAPAIDWSNVGKAAADLYGGGKQDPFSGMSMPGGLGSPLSAPSGASPFNWSDLWGGKGGGGYTSGISPDTTGGGSMPSLDVKSPSTGYNTFQGAGASGYTSGIAPDTSGGQGFEWPAAGPASGMAMPGGLGSPMTMPAQEPAKSQDQPAFDSTGGGVGGINAPAAPPSSERLLGYTPQKQPVEFDANTFVSPSTNYDIFQAPAQDGGGGTDKIVEEARQRLADIIGSPETVKAVESPATDYSKFQQPGMAAADALRPPDKVDTSLQGKVDFLRNTVRKELEAQGLYMTSDYRGPSHELYRPGSQHSNALAFDTRARTPEQADAAMSKIREVFDARGMVEGRDYKFIDEVRNPIGGITRGPHIHTTLTPEGMQRYQESAYDVNRGQVIPRPPADIPPQGPLPPERPQPLPEGTSRPPAGVFPEARLAPNGEAPTAFVVHHTEGRPTLESTVADWKARGGTLGSQYFLDRNGVVHDVAAETNYTGTTQTRTGNVQGAKDLNNSNVVGIEISARDGADMTPGQIAALQQFVDARYPTTPVYGHAEIDKDKDRAEGISRANEILDARVAANPNMFPSAGFWDRLAEQNKTGAVPLPTPRPEGADVPRPPADTPPAKPAGPSGIEKAQTFLNTSVDKLLQRYAPDKAGPAGMFIDTTQPLREALKGPYGDQILSGIQPRLGEAGLKRDDLAKAIADPRARFVEGGDFGPYPAYTGPEAAPGDGGYTSGIAPDTTGGRTFGGGGDVYSQFRRSENVEDRRGEQGPITDTSIDDTWWQNDTPTAPESTSMRDSPSPASRDDLAALVPEPTGLQQGPTMPSWQASIPQDRRDPDTIAAVEEGARRTGLSPEAIAAVITEESVWDPQHATGQFRGLTQMQEQTFKEAPGGRINGLTWEQYKNASGADQVKAYIDWIYQHNSLDRAANLGIDIRGMDPAEQAAWLQAFQFSPYGGLPEVKIPWVQEAFKGNYGMPVTNKPQAKDLGDVSLNAMRYRYGEEMMKNWPDTGRLPGER